jgi:capsid protein
MSLLGRIFGRSTRPGVAAPMDRQIRGSFDAQHTTDGNRRHWQQADGLAVDAMANPMARRVLRQRNRYEYHNNSYYFGIANTLADYVIGVGPRLQMLTDDKAINKAIEDLFWTWSQAVRLGQVLRSMRLARTYNGEAFVLLRNNPNLDHPVKLDLTEIEADQVATPTFPINDVAQNLYYDGVVLDAFGRPKAYHILRQHPGAAYPSITLSGQYDTWDAAYVLHDFQPSRPAQVRGIPEFTPALEPIARRRKFSVAVVNCATTAALNQFVIQTEVETDDFETGKSFEVIEFSGSGGLTLPPGYKASQMRAEQPTATYAEFDNAQLREICRCVGVPLMIASLDASQANMSSAYVIMQPFNHAAKVDREHNYDPKLDRLFAAVIAEARLIPGALPDNLPEILPHTWQWPKLNSHADPQKVASARQTALINGTTSIPQICAEDGDDWEEVEAQAAKSLGMEIDELRSARKQRLFALPGNPAPETLDPEDQPQGQPPGKKTPAESAD